jgi:hypothetical protein
MHHVCSHALSDKGHILITVGHSHVTSQVRFLKKRGKSSSFFWLGDLEKNQVRTWTLFLPNRASAHLGLHVNSFFDLAGMSCLFVFPEWTLIEWKYWKIIITNLNHNIPEIRIRTRIGRVYRRWWIYDLVTRADIIAPPHSAIADVLPISSRYYSTSMSISRCPITNITMTPIRKNLLR